MKIAQYETVGKLSTMPEAGAVRQFIMSRLEDVRLSTNTQICVRVGLCKKDDPAVKNTTVVGAHRILVCGKEHTTSGGWLSVQIAIEGMMKKLPVSLELLAVFQLQGEDYVPPPAPEPNAEMSAPAAKADSEEPQVDWEAIEPQYRREQWIVSSEVASKFDDALSIIRNRKMIYEKWGFGSIDPHARAVVCFYGPPGTGKSMAAHVMAAELGCPIICASYAQIESKFMGQSPKRLRSVFAAAKAKGAVLFFDEADSFLGKRIENVSQSADQAVNSLRGEMLILLEEFDGVVLFATNLHSNFDPAFDSRVLAHIEVELPNAEARRAIILSKLPSGAPKASDVDDMLMDELTEITEGFAGRDIKNAMLMGLVKAARRIEGGEEELVRAADLRAAFTELKDTRENLAKDRQAHGGGGISLSDKKQPALLKVVKDAMAEKKGD